MNDTSRCDSITGFVPCSMSIAASDAVVERSGLNDTMMLRADKYEVVL